MTPQIALALAILGLAVVLFATERLRMDLVALLVLGALALTGLVTPTEALAGFSSPAVVTVWAVFILSGGLARTGVASVIGRHVLWLAGKSEARLIATIMLSAGLMSGFMNNVGVAALLLPVVMDIARRTGQRPSRLLMPLAFGSLLGGLTTLIGTSSNIIISDALSGAGLRPFALFDLTPTGLTALLLGVAYMVLVGRHLLPERDISWESVAGQPDWRELYDLRQRLFTLHLPEQCALDGRPLATSRLGSALELNVVALVREKTHLAPGPATILSAGDRLLVQGRMDRLTELQGRRHLVMEENDLAAQMLAGQEVGIVRVRLAPDSELAGKTLRESSFRRRWGLNVMALTRNGRLLEADLQDTPLRPGDVLLLHGRTTHLEALEQPRDWELAEFVSPAEVLANAGIRERLMSLSIPEDSVFSGRTLAESRLGDSFGLTVLSIGRQDGSLTAPDSDVHLQAGDRLLVRGAPGDLQTLRGLQQLEVEQRAPVDMDWLESEETGLMEAVLSPHTTLLGKTLRELHFREKYGLSVLAVWRQGRAYRSNLRDMALHLGDALLLYGPREKLQLLGAEPDFLVLTEAAQQPLRLSKAPLAVMVMAAVLLPVIAGWVPISIAAVAGATLMVLTGCLNMEEAYRNIEWKAVFLIAGMLPLGLAIEQTGAARWLVSGVLNLVGDLGPLVMVASVFVMTALAMQILPTQAAAVLMAPIALNLAADMNLSAHAVMMAVVLASGSFLSPYAHPANVLVMGPGGYRYVDYIKVGAPLVLLLLVVTLVVMPLFWPL